MSLEQVRSQAQKVQSEKDWGQDLVRLQAPPPETRLGQAYQLVLTWVQDLGQAQRLVLDPEPVQKWVLELAL